MSSVLVTKVESEALVITGLYMQLPRRLLRLINRILRKVYTGYYGTVQRSETVGSNIIILQVERIVSIVLPW